MCGVWPSSLLQCVEVEVRGNVSNVVLWKLWTDDFCLVLVVSFCLSPSDQASSPRTVFVTSRLFLQYVVYLLLHRSYL